MPSDRRAVSTLRVTCMRFGQKVHPLNFDYGNSLFVLGDSAHLAGNSFRLQIRCEEITGCCTRLSFDNANVADKRQYSDAIIEACREGRSISPALDEGVCFQTRSSTIVIGPARLHIRMATGAVLETTEDGIGINGEQFLLNFRMGGASGFYGFGERTRRLNKHGDSLDFWNVDVVAAFPHTYDRDDYDPAYVAIPFAIIKTGTVYTGVYFDNPDRAIIDIGKIRSGQWLYQSMGGNTQVYLINGPRLRDVVRGFTELTGRAEVPPVWSIGYHQCRWGYRSEADFIALKEHFKRHDIPVSALWYDIDYMDGYRLFTWDREDFPDPAVLNNELKEAGIRTVTIMDPGVKLERGYPVYDSGKAEDVFCKAVSGKEYVGRVWPGDTVFPDFTLEAARDWWAAWLAKFLSENAVDGVWLDMNDPATGFSAAEDMRFANGQLPHAKYHNQYAHYMAKASREAFTKLDPRTRPFLLTRSGCTGTQRYSAIWTGDNASNWKHLRMAIPSTLNLGLSGVVFNGPDVGGFMGHTTAELLIRWYQAGFLFPFFRNHSVWNSKSQEPWQFNPQCLAYVRETVVTRYRLLPYLYQCFFVHYLSGDPVLRPLLYDYDGKEFEDLDDQFLVGDSIMVAPILEGEEQGREIMVGGRKCQVRHIVLPPGWWFDLNQGEWLEGNRILQYAAGLEEVPLFVRDGSIIPYYNGPIRNSFITLQEIELHIFSKQRPARLAYFIDDRETRDYQAGRYGTAQIDARVDDGEINVGITEAGDYETGTVNFRPVLYGYQGQWKAVTAVNGKLQTRSCTVQTRSWVCKHLSVLA